MFPNSCTEFTSADIKLLQVPCRTIRSSGYRNVYFCGLNDDGVPVWKAKVKQGRHLRHLSGSASIDPRVSAQHVLRWYADTFGPGWRDVLRGRKRNPWAWFWSEKYGGYTITVWVMGMPEKIVRLKQLRRGRYVPTDRIESFPTTAEAKAAMWEYLEARYGLFARACLWRPREAERQAARGRAA